MALLSPRMLPSGTLRPLAPGAGRLAYVSQTLSIQRRLEVPRSQSHCGLYLLSYTYSKIVVKNVLASTCLRSTSPNSRPTTPSSVFGLLPASKRPLTMLRLYQVSIYTELSYTSNVKTDKRFSKSNHADPPIAPLE